MKHLQVLEGAGLVSHHKRGREVLYALEPGPIEDARIFLDGISASWDRRLERLRAMVEEPASGPAPRVVARARRRTRANAATARKKLRGSR